MSADDSDDPPPSSSSTLGAQDVQFALRGGAAQGVAAPGTAAPVAVSGLPSCVVPWASACCRSLLIPGTFLYVRPLAVFALGPKA